MSHANSITCMWKTLEIKAAGDNIPCSGLQEMWQRELDFVKGSIPFWLSVAIGMPGVETQPSGRWDTYL